ncbi:hypothetical protein RvY_15003 [Ramazzottius varieornatus]|uniref:NR LBD domain-containing protein n=1 Tax=Ramazzottius varieornatus TaxID=947166 RepID=A0A1D1VTA4_RAMVA|nr:hypothetical protein RvY_15003 [Ramazzottius varieornatus]
MASSPPTEKLGLTLSTWTSVQFDPPRNSYENHKSVKKVSRKTARRLGHHRRPTVASKSDICSTPASHQNPINSGTLGSTRASDVSVIIFAARQHEHPTVSSSSSPLPLPVPASIPLQNHVEDPAGNPTRMRSPTLPKTSQEIPTSFWHIPSDLQTFPRFRSAMAGGYPKPTLAKALDYYLTGFPGEEKFGNFNPAFLEQLHERGTAFCKGYHTREMERLQYQGTASPAGPIPSEQEVAEDLRRTAESFWPATLSDELKKLLSSIPSFADIVTVVDMSLLAYSGATSVCLLHSSLYWRNECLHPFFRTHSCYSKNLPSETLLGCLISGTSDIYRRICDNSQQIQNSKLTFLEVLVATLVVIVNPARHGLKNPFHVGAVQGYLMRVLSTLLKTRTNMSPGQFSSLLLCLSDLDALAATVSALYI